MIVLSEPFAAVYDDRSRLGVILARMRMGGFEAYAADHSPRTVSEATISDENTSWAAKWTKA
jgi:hypothetical protein